jgi:hypothetical protein
MTVRLVHDYGWFQILECSGAAGFQVFWKCLAMIVPESRSNVSAEPFETTDGDRRGEEGSTGSARLTRRQASLSFHEIASEHSYGKLRTACDSSEYAYNMYSPRTKLGRLLFGTSFPALCSIHSTALEKDTS